MLQQAHLSGHAFALAASLFCVRGAALFNTSFTARGSVVCSRLGALARTGAELCASAGLAAAAGACYDGKPPGLLESCRAPPARARRRKGRGATAGAGAWASTLVFAFWERLMVIAGIVCVCVVWRMAAVRRRSTARVYSPQPAHALPWGADARFPGRGRFLNE